MEEAQNTAPPYSRPTAIESKRSIGLPMVTGIALCTLFIGGVVGYYFATAQNKQVNSLLYDVSPSIIPTQSINVTGEEISPTVIPTGSNQSAVLSVPTLSAGWQRSTDSTTGISYAIPSSWSYEARKSEIGNLVFSLGGNSGGYLAFAVYSYSGTTGRREFYCQIVKYCIDSTYFTPVQYGNIEGYRADALDNSGGGADYFGAKGNKFYIINSYNPPSPNDFETYRDQVLRQLIF